jgi:hypothetical protein
LLRMIRSVRVVVPARGQIPAKVTQIRADLWSKGGQQRPDLS